MTRRITKHVYVLDAKHFPGDGLAVFFEEDNNVEFDKVGRTLTSVRPLHVGSLEKKLLAETGQPVTVTLMT